MKVSSYKDGKHSWTEAGTSKETDALVTPEKVQPCQHFDFSR